MMKKIFCNSYFHSAIVFLYFFLLNYLLFQIDENLLSIFLITFFSFIFFVGLRSISKGLSFLFLLLCFLIYVPYYIAQQLFGLITPPQMIALYFTNSSEVFSYISTIPLALMVEAIISALPLLFLHRLSILGFNRKIAIAFILFPVLYSGIKIYLHKDYLFTKWNQYYIFKTVYISPLRVASKIMGVRYIVEQGIEIQNNLQKRPHSWKISNVEDNDKITVFVIGESVRKDFMGLYNPHLNNTPFLNKTPKIQFDNAISFAATTIESLSNAFQQKIDGQPYFPNNIITLVKAAGFKTIWLSNQGSIGVHDNAVAAMAKQADKYQFLTSGTFETYKKDETLLSLLEKELTTDPKNVYFLHTIESHPSPCSITNGEYRKSYSSKEISCYIESIYRTDQLIEKLYAKLKKLNRPFQIVYFSDHGLYLNPHKVLIHKAGYKQSYEIPLVIIDSELKENQHIKTQRNLRDFMLLYQYLLKIKTDNIPVKYNFISEEPDPTALNLDMGLKYNRLKDNSSNF